jgi:hypothetical protein
VGGAVGAVPDHAYVAAGLTDPAGFGGDEVVADGLNALDALEVGVPGLGRVGEVSRKYTGNLWCGFSLESLLASLTNWLLHYCGT